MRIFIWAMFLLVMAINWLWIYSTTEFNPNDTNRKYITVKNRKLAKLLIDEKSSHVKYVKTKDRLKLNISCLIFYIAFALILVVAVALFFAPEIPCEPVRLPFGRRHSVVVDTYNLKIPSLLAWLLAALQADLRILPGSIKLLKKKNEPIGSKIGIGIMTVGFLFFTCGLVYLLIK